MASSSTPPPVRPEDLRQPELTLAAPGNPLEVVEQITVNPTYPVSGTSRQQPIVLKRPRSRPILSKAALERKKRAERVEAARAAGIANPSQRTAGQLARHAKARTAAVREKLREGLPLTPEEAALITGRNAGPAARVVEEAALRKELAAAEIRVMPRSIIELRQMVEATVQTTGYNPILSLIDLAQNGDLDDKEVVAIHKALLPFIVPAITVPREAAERMMGEANCGNSGPRVVIQQFVLPPDSDHRPLHARRPLTALDMETAGKAPAPAPIAPSLTVRADPDATTE